MREKNRLRKEAIKVDFPLETQHLASYPSCRGMLHSTSRSNDGLTSTTFQHMQIGLPSKSSLISVD